MFVVALFFVKNKTIFENSEPKNSIANETGLVYGDETLEDLVNKDTDGDGILDWQESLYGLDPTKKETTPGTPDSAALKRMKVLEGSEGKGESLLTDIDSQKEENLSQTDKFSRELFATIVAANQSGTMDQATIDALSAALAEKIENPVTRKVFLLSDIKIGANEDTEAVKKYGDALNNIQNIYTIDYTVLDVLQKFSVDENDVDMSALKKLDPIIAQTNKVISAALKMSVPKFLSVLHLNVINSLQRLYENISDIKLYEDDTIVAFGAIFQYNQNASALESDLNILQNTITQKLNN